MSHDHLLAQLLPSSFYLEIKLGNLMIGWKILNLKHLKACYSFGFKIACHAKEQGSGPLIFIRPIYILVCNLCKC